MASATQWTWLWVDSGSWWWTGRPGVLGFMGSQKVRHNWVTGLNLYTCLCDFLKCRVACINDFLKRGIVRKCHRATVLHHYSLWEEECRRNQGLRDRLTRGWHRDDSHCWPLAASFSISVESDGTHSLILTGDVKHLFTGKKQWLLWGCFLCLKEKNEVNLTRTKPLTLAHSLITQKMTGSWEQFLDIFYTSVTF